MAPRAALGALGVCFAVRALLYLTGTRFSTSYLTYGWQIVPAETLERDPLGSVWYLHTQPPLFNLATGGLLRWSPFAAGITFQLAFLLMVGLLVVVSHDVFVRLGASPVLAAAVAVFVFCDPDWIRYELTPQYEVPVALLVTLTIWALLRLGAHPTLGRWMALSAILSAVVLTRSLFHPLWLAIVVVAALWWLSGRWRWRDVALVAAVPCVLVGGWMLKNQLLFDQPTLSSWLGMNLQRAVISPLTPAQLDHLIAEGTVSEMAAVQPFSSYESYAAFTDPCSSRRSHAAVSLADRENGVPNFNYDCYLPVYDRLAGDARAAITAEPGRYLYGRWWGLRNTFSRGFVEVETPAGDGQAVFLLLEDVYRFPMLDLPIHLSQNDWALPLVPVPFIAINVSLTLVACLLWQLVALGRDGWSLIRRQRDDPLVLARAVAAFTIVWTVMVGALFEIGENARFRIMVQPLLVGLAVVALAPTVARLVQRVRDRRRNARAMRRGPSAVR